MARDYRSTNDGISASSFALSVKIRPNDNQTIEEMDKEAVVELISRVCVFMVEGKLKKITQKKSKKEYS